MVGNGAIMGSANAALGGGSLGDVFTGAGIGAASGFVGAKLGGKIIPRGTMSGSPIFDGAIKGAIGGAGTGFVMGTGIGLVRGQSFGDALVSGFTGATNGMLIGGISGGAYAGVMAYKQGINPFTGEFSNKQISKGGVAPGNKGKAGVAKAEIDLPEHGIKIIGRQIHVRIGDRTRIYDLAGFENGKFVLIEIKNGPSAAYKPNQNACNSYIVEGVKPIPFGNMAAEAGFRLGVPADVKIITVWYNGDNEIYIDIINSQY